MAIIEIYSGPYCVYCLRAKALLKRKGVEYTEYDIYADPSRRVEMIDRSNGARTIPQIFINGCHIGGSDELHALEKAGKLDSWIRCAA
jgi:glutaredoxin 3